MRRPRPSNGDNVQARESYQRLTTVWGRVAVYAEVLCTYYLALGEPAPGLEEWQWVRNGRDAILGICAFG